MGAKRQPPAVPQKRPPSGGKPGPVRSPFQPLEGRQTIRGRGGRETKPGYAIGPGDRLIPYVNDPRLKGKSVDYSQSPYRNIRRQYQQSNRGPKGEVGIGGGPGIPPKFPGGGGFGIGGGPGIPPKFPNSTRVRGGGRKRPSGPRDRRSCPDPNMFILMSDGTQKKAGDLKVGDLIKTNHEETLELGEYKVEYVNILENVEKIKLIFDESVIICSLTHKFYVDDSWKEAKDMVIGDEVSGKKLLSIENVEDGDVVHITVEDAHTYICEGLLSHNKRMLPTDPRRAGGLVPVSRPLGDVPVSRPRRGGRRGGPRIPLGPDGKPVSDPTLGGPPEREVPIPKERIRPITRESDPRGGAPFGPDERAMARDRFFERMYERADERRQQGSMEREERREVNQARMDERRARRDQPGEINVGNERQAIRRSMQEERAARRMQPGEIDVGGEIDINAERGGRRRRRRGGGEIYMRRNMRRGRRDFTRRRSNMNRRRSREERAAFRDRYVSTLGGGFFS